jgi:polyhydroxyalkanoate synthase
MPAVAERLGSVLRDYGGSGRPALFVPSLINPPNVLDLGEERSLLRWLARAGHRPLLLDWGWDVERRRDLDVTGHLEKILLPLIEELDEAPALLGYCLGGTMAIAAATAGKVRSVAAIAAPWRFSGFPDDARQGLAALWRQGEPAARQLGVFPMELLQSAFWNLDPGRTIAKFERFAAMDRDAAEAFVLLEDWANDGPPIPGAAARELFESFFAADLPGEGEWEVDGRRIDPSDLPVPLLNIVSTTDRIVPAASAAEAGERLELAQGHVGMVVGSRARETLWERLSHWLSQP